MHYPGYNSGANILSEGKYFPFKVYNIVQLQDQEWYYILQDINGLKHFLHADHYKHYSFKTGEEITCKVEKINCTGRVYLEPTHPYYKEGEIYDFKLVGFNKNKAENCVVVSDIFGNKIEIRFSDDRKLTIKNENIMSCFVKSIRKGVPILEMISSNS
jgi:hypothetical protein